MANSTRVRRAPAAASSPGESGARARTRQAILDAAVRALAADPAASLGTVAELADVGRTTLHRYFPERADLLDAVARHAVTAIGAAHARARLDEGTALEALLRVAQEYLELGDLLTILFTGLLPEEAWANDVTNADALVAVCARGRTDGTLDARMPDDWSLGMMWSALYLAWSTVRAGDADRHAVVGNLLLTLRKALGSTLD
ncbi:TetR/AcrR family transcriptional regulator [Cellulomonas shaoxiangyii]|uniref:TetR/AcrR family transcriptional regulator n=1 Tax=Cellulomonas shaoxiangyii TaxID=2566013 RepID=A0A4V1CMF5_9CELL|nr:TetR family transcriptional regulator [Cellulomonas shaoxiangyii]QCB92765.1 TetR/AcrR family transcriptional regulator [Cellulomonas shaoxiangyii]TGY81531.1 TetR/AcrR family transcriptional regulator [Cellulomonas shaoxiangyii]